MIVRYFRSVCQETLSVAHWRKNSQNLVNFKSQQLSFFSSLVEKIIPITLKISIILFHRSMGKENQTLNSLST